MILLTCATFGLLSPARAAADRILSERSFWNASRTRIYTELTVAKSDGSVETVRVPGGAVDGYAMVVYALGGESPYLAYVREKTRTGKPFRWEKSCIYLTLDPAGTTDLDGELEFQIIEAVLSHWEQSVAPCSYIRFHRTERRTGEVRFDGVNLLKFREDKWCIPAMDGEPEECHDPQAAALTTILYVPHEGEREGVILDVDIEVNAVHFAVSAAGQSRGTGTRADLANVLTHEIGHMIGLDHTCWDGTGTRPIDGDGNPVPSCSDPDLPPEVTEATMYNFLDAGETKKATLEADDIRGVCESYPKDADPGECAPAYEEPDDGWCAVAVAAAPAAERSLGGRWPIVLLLGAGLGLVLRASRRERRTRQ